MAGPAPASSLTYLCSLLCFLGLRDISPQLLLLAAKNDPSATDALLSCLVELVMSHLTLTSPSTPPTLTSIHDTKQQQSVPFKDQKTRSSSIRGRNGQIHLQSRDNDRHKNASADTLNQGPSGQVYDKQSSRDKLSIVKFYLAVWGYPPQSPLFGLPCDTKESSHLFFALGWLISYCDSFRRALEKQWSWPTGGKPEIVSDVHCTNLAIERRRAAQAKTKEYVGKVIVAADNLDDSRLRLKTRADQLLMLYGRVRTTMRNLHALISCKAKRIHEINHIQISNGIHMPYNQFQLHLLEDKHLLENHLQKLEDMKLMIQKLEECDKHEGLFWQWMAEVATETCRHNYTDVQQQTHVPEMGSTKELASILDVSEKASLLNDDKETTYTDISEICEQTRELQVGKGSEGTNTTETWTRNLTLALKFFRQQLSKQRSSAAHQRPADVPKLLDRQTIDTTTKVCKGDKLLFAEFLSSWWRTLFVQGDCRDNERSADKRIQSLKDIAMSLASILAKIRAQNRSKIEEALHIPMGNENNLFAGI